MVVQINTLILIFGADKTWMDFASNPSLFADGPDIASSGTLWYNNCAPDPTRTYVQWLDTLPRKTCFRNWSS